MNRPVVGVTLVGTWLACLGWLAARELRPPPEGGAPRATVRLAPGAAFFAVTLAGRQIGTAGTTLDTTTLGYRLTEVMALDLPADSGERRDVIRGEATLGRLLQLTSAQATVSEGGRALTLEAEARGGSSLVLSVRRGQAELDRAGFRLTGRAPTVPGAIALRLVAGRLLRPRGGQAMTTVDLLSGTVRDGAVLVGPDSVFVVGSSKHNNEQSYLLRKWVSLWGTNNCDHQARICHSTTVAGVDPIDQRKPHLARTGHPPRAHRVARHGDGAAAHRVERGADRAGGGREGFLLLPAETLWLG